MPNSSLPTAPAARLHRAVIGLRPAVSLLVVLAMTLADAAPLAGTAALAAVAAQPSEATPSERISQPERPQDKQRPQDSKPFSPLHDFLGIDAQTGQFKPPPSRSASPTSAEGATQDDGATQDAQRSAGRGAPGGTAPNVRDRPPRSAPTIDDLPRTAEEANEALRRTAEQISSGSLEELSAVFAESMQSNPVLRLHRQLVWIIAGLMLVYPLGMVLSALLGYAAQRRRSGMTELDRRFQRMNLWRRLALAAAVAAIILLFALGSINSYWWNQPAKLAIFAALMVVFGSLAVVLANLTRQSTRTYQLDLIRDIRREQLEMRAELEELRRQMHQTLSS